MKRGKLNILVDLVSLLILLMVVSSGLVLKLVLPPGSGRLPGEGGPHEEILLLWGFSRHQWGLGHSWVSIALLLILALHICLHWRFIKGVLLKGEGPERRGKMIFGLSGLALLLALVMAPLFSPVKVFKVDTSTALTSLPAPGAALYKQECQRCHAGRRSGIPSLPEGREGVDYLRNAKPSAPHAQLKDMSDVELQDLLQYLNGQED